MQSVPPVRRRKRKRRKRRRRLITQTEETRNVLGLPRKKTKDVQKLLKTKTDVPSVTSRSAPTEGSRNVS